jgi:hypothetical protein
MPGFYGAKEFSYTNKTFLSGPVPISRMFDRLSLPGTFFSTQAYTKYPRKHFWGCPPK